MRLAIHLAASVLLAGIFLAIPSHACAQSSTNSITLQAKIDGVSGPTVNLTVKFFDALTGGTQIGATITLNNQPVQSGIVSVPVSPVDATIFNGQTRYMEIAANGTMLSPRTLVTSVPHSIRATMADGVGTLSQTVNVRGNLGVVCDPAQNQELFVRGGPVRCGWGGEPGGFASYSPFGLTHHAFDGEYIDAQETNWKNTGIPYNFYNIAGAYSPYSGFGTNIGANLDSPVIWMYGPTTHGTNSFDVRKVGFQGNPARGTTLFSVREDGMTQVRTLQILGADVAEPFDIAGSATSPKPIPGMVMSIDPASPGKLMLASTPYDKKVAGAISGAGGLSVGVVMGKDNADPLIKGDLPVAMSGRVYVYCDASFGVITPGDRLTTSTTPGHAMRVSDESRAGGAVIGKAMTGLKNGKGLVLVLVNLQ